jgi:hypothetical protein
MVMKILIWLGCALLYGVVITVFKFAGYQLGGLPAALIGALVLWLAITLCKLWDRKPRNPKVSARAIIEALSKYNTPWPIVFILIVVILAVCYQNFMLQKDVESKDAEIVGLESEYDRGYEAGRDAGYDLAAGDAYSEGYSDGYKNGYDEGYIDGYTYGLTDGLYYPDTIDDYTKGYLLLRRERLDEEKAD